MAPTAILNDPDYRPLARPAHPVPTTPLTLDMAMQLSMVERTSTDTTCAPSRSRGSRGFMQRTLAGVWDWT